MCFLVLETYYVICLLDAWWRHGKSLFVSDYWFCTHKVISFIGISWPTSYYDVVLCTLTQCNLWLIDRLEKAIMISKISSLVMICLLLKSLYSHMNYLKDVTIPRIMQLPTFDSKKPNLTSNKLSSEKSEARTTDAQWRHKWKKSENLGWCGRQNMLQPYLKIWGWD